MWNDLVIHYTKQQTDFLISEFILPGMILPELSVFMYQQVSLYSWKQHSEASDTLGYIVLY